MAIHRVQYNKYGPGGSLGKTTVAVKDFYNSYMSSPNYAKRLQLQGYDNPTGTINLRRAVMNATQPVLNTGRGSYFDRGTKVLIDPSEGYGLPNTLAHEYSHAAGSMGFTPQNADKLKLNTNEIAAINSRNRLRSIDTSKMPSNKAWEIDHDKIPSEAKADIDTLRFRLKQDKIYDTGTQDFNKDFLNKSKAKYGNDPMLKRVFQRFNDNDLIYLMNNIAANKQANTTTYAAKGGTLMKYRRGGQYRKYYVGGPYGTGLGGKSILSSADQQAADAAMQQWQQQRGALAQGQGAPITQVQNQVDQTGTALEVSRQQRNQQSFQNFANTGIGAAGSIVAGAGKAAAAKAAVDASKDAGKGLFSGKGWQSNSGTAIGGAAAGLIGGVIDARNQPNQFGHKNTGAAIGSGALQGAAMGSVAGPWGMAAGAVIGGAVGGITSAMGNKKATGRELAFNTARDQDIRSRSALRYMDEAAAGMPGRTWYAQGGALSIPYRKLAKYGGGGLGLPRTPDSTGYYNNRLAYASRMRNFPVSRDTTARAPGFRNEEQYQRWQPQVDSFAAAAARQPLKGQPGFNAYGQPIPNYIPPAQVSAELNRPLIQPPDTRRMADGGLIKARNGLLIGAPQQRAVAESTAAPVRPLPLAGPVKPGFQPVDWRRIDQGTINPAAGPVVSAPTPEWNQSNATLAARSNQRVTDNRRDLGNVAYWGSQVPFPAIKYPSMAAASMISALDARDAFNAGDRTGALINAAAAIPGVNRIAPAADKAVRMANAYNTTGNVPPPKTKLGIQRRGGPLQKYGPGGDIKANATPVVKDPAIKGPVGYLNSYYNSPMFQERGSYEISPGLNYVATPDYPNALARTYNPIIDNSANGESYADRITGKVMLSPKQAKESGMDLLNDVVPHEYSHLTRALTYHDAKKIAGLNRNSGKANMLLKNWHDKHYDSKDDPNYSDILYAADLMNKGFGSTKLDPHAISPHENYSDLNSMRYLMYKQGIYDTRKGPMTKEHLEKAMKDPYIRKQFTFKRMLENFTPENIVELNNTVAKNKSKSAGVRYAAHGGQLRKYKPGGQTGKTTTPASSTFYQTSMFDVLNTKGAQDATKVAVDDKGNYSTEQYSYVKPTGNPVIDQQKRVIRKLGEEVINPVNKFNMAFNARQKQYRAEKQKEDLITADPNDTIKLTKGRFRGAVVPKVLLKEAKKAADTAGTPVDDLVTLMGRESTLGEYHQAPESMDLGYLVSGHTIDDQYKPKDLNRFLYENKVPGISYTKSVHGDVYDVANEAAVKQHLMQNPQLFNKYQEALAKTPSIAGKNSLYLAAEKLKKQGVAAYNPGDKRYPAMFKADYDVLKTEPELQKYLRGAASAQGVPTTARVTGLQSKAKGGQIQKLSSTANEFVGPSHANGGIKLPAYGAEVEGGETEQDGYVFSKDFGIADIHRPIAKAIGRIEKKPMTPERLNTLKMLNKQVNHLKAINEWMRIND